MEDLPLYKWFVAMTIILGALSFPKLAFSETSESWRKNNFKVQRSLCSRVEDSKKFKLMVNYARKKGATIGDFFEFALCPNTSNIEVHFANNESVISPVFMVILKPHSRFAILNNLINYHKKNGDKKQLLRILNQQAQRGRITVLDFLEQESLDFSDDGAVNKMYNIIRQRICSVGGRHAKKENAGKCSDAFLKAQ